eukprot:1822090-Pyramimonas_sp.AAC.2
MYPLYVLYTLIRGLGRVSSPVPIVPGNLPAPPGSPRPNEVKPFLSALDVPGVAFMTLSESIAGLFGVKAAGSWTQFALALSTGGVTRRGDEALDVWMLTDPYGKSIFGAGDNAANPFVQLSWQRHDTVEEMRAQLWSAQGGKGKFVGGCLVNSVGQGLGKHRDADAVNRVLMQATEHGSVTKALRTRQGVGGRFVMSCGMLS